MAASSKVTQSPASTLSLAASTWCVVVDSRWYILRLFKKYLLGKVYPIVIYCKGPFKYYIIKEVGWWGQKMAILDNLKYCKLSKSWVGGPKKVKNMMT